MAKTSSEFYRRWRRIMDLPHVPEWDDLTAFEEWAKDTGYQYGDILKPIDKTKPYGPDNCKWIYVGHYEGDADAFVARWNKTVNMFRKAARLPLFDVREEWLSD